MKENTEYVNSYKNHFTELSNLFGLEKPAHAVLPFDYQDQTMKNIRLFDWFKMNENDRYRFYDVFGDIGEDNVLEEFIAIKVDEYGIISPELKEGVIPFAYVINDGAEEDDWQWEGLLMLDVRRYPSRVLIANIDGTIDGNDPFVEVSFDSLQIKPGKILK